MYIHHNFTVQIQCLSKVQSRFRNWDDRFPKVSLRLLCLWSTVVIHSSFSSKFCWLFPCFPVLTPTARTVTGPLVWLVVVVVGYVLYRVVRFVLQVKTSWHCFSYFFFSDNAHSSELSSVVHGQLITLQLHIRRFVDVTWISSMNYVGLCILWNI